MNCQACATANEDGRRFCKACGQPLSIVCDVCGGVNTPDARFCGECGSELTTQGSIRLPSASVATDAVQPGPAMTTERRLVSVLFVDLVGSTALAEHRDAEEIRELLGQYFDAARDAIERHGGLVEKFIGDAVMAVWGTPVAHEDDAERAVRAALEVIDAVEVLGLEVGVPLNARAGVLTGEAAATVGAVHQGIVTGDLVNTASRIQSAAEPGWVLVGEATYRAANRGIAFEEVGALTLKGKDEVVLAWRALRVVADVGGANRGPGLEPPFVGRAEEFRALKEALHATGREGKARMVSIVGISGMGKSRLAWELEKYIDGLSDLVYWHRGRCPAYGDAISFWALAEMVRMRAGIAEIDDLTTARTKLAASVADLARDDDERRWLEPRLAHLLALDDGESGEREELFSAWRTYFERIAERGPTAMVFEDIQWADSGLLDFIGSILEWSRSSQIVIVTLSRPDLEDRRPGWGVGQRNLQSLHLEPLDASVMEELVRGFVRGIPDESVDRIVERAEGVPLYAVETVRMLVDRGTLAPSGEVYETVGDVGDLEIPETLQALIAARLDALPAEQRALLQDAAVLGKSFTRQALAAVSGAQADSLEPMLRDLTRREFLLHEADPRSPERGQYGFVQSLIREVVYGQLARADRRTRHLSTAHHLESLGDESLAGAVASHYVEAYRSTSAGPEADALAARARDWLAQAADRALSLGSPEQALGYVEQALEITDPGAERAALLERASKAAAMSSLEAASDRYFGEALDAFAALGDPVGEGRVLSIGARFREPTEGLLERMMAAIDAVEALGTEAAPDVLAALYRGRAGMARISGENEVALGYIERALPILEALDDREGLGESMALKAIALYALGRQYESRVLLEGAQQMAEATSSAAVRSMVLMMLGSLLSDEPRSMFQASLDGAEAARRVGDRPRESVALGNALELAIDLGEWQTAETIAAELDERPNSTTQSRDAVSMCRAMLAAYRGDDDAASSLLASAGGAPTSGMIDQRTWYLRTSSLVHLLAGRLDEAMAEGTRAVEDDRLGGNAPTALAGVARAALWKPDADTAKRALEAMAPLRGPWMDAVRDGMQAGIDALAGRRDVATEGFRRAIDAFAAMELGLDVALTVVDAVVVLASSGVSVGELERTRAYLTELGAAPLLERLEGATLELRRG